MAVRRTLALLIFTSACGHVAPLGTGGLELQWRVAPSGCADAGIDVVEIRATGPHAIVERFACDAERASLPELTPGSYRIELLGFDPNGVAAFRADAVQVDVAADATTEPSEFRLLAAPGAVAVRWSFENGKVCGANNARWVAISAFDEFDYEVATASFPCDDGMGDLPALRAGSYLIEATALDSSTNALFRGSSSTKLSRGQTAELDLQLDRL